MVMVETRRVDDDFCAFEEFCPNRVLSDMRLVAALASGYVSLHSYRRKFTVLITLFR